MAVKSGLGWQVQAAAATTAAPSPNPNPNDCPGIPGAVIVAATRLSHRMNVSPMHPERLWL